MKIFISSLIGGFEDLREATARGIEALGHSAVQAEDFGATATSPQSACLAAARDSDIVILILGERYGYVQPSGLSATHEEFEEIRDSHPVLVFIQKNINPDPAQRGFIEDVQSWDKGLYTAEFDGAEQLRDLATRAIHEYEVSRESTTLDDAEIAGRAAHLIPPVSNGFGSSAKLVVAVAGGPLRSVLRPGELGAPELELHLQAQALTGPNAVLDIGEGTKTVMEGNSIRLVQADHELRLAEDGSVVVQQPAMLQKDWAGRTASLPSIIEEDIQERIASSIRFCGTLLDHVDRPQRLSHVAVVVALLGAEHAGWRTRAEAAANPSTLSLGMGQSDPQAVIALSPPVRRRGVLLQDNPSMAEDFMVRLRRAVKS